MIEAYPLHWPANRRRTQKEKRQRANFSKKDDSKTYTTFKKVSIAEAVKRILSELDKYTKRGEDYRVPPESIIISTNLPVRKDGLPFSNLREPDDTGAAVYFTLDGKQYCLPCDKWDRVADNLAAIAAHISAMRGIERWGVGESHDVYTGFKALPEQTDSEAMIWKTLGLDEKPNSFELVKIAYRKQSKIVHPDLPGGSTQAFHNLQKAYDQAQKLFQ